MSRSGRAAACGRLGQLAAAVEELLELPDDDVEDVALPAEDESFDDEPDDSVELDSLAVEPVDEPPPPDPDERESLR